MGTVLLEPVMEAFKAWWSAESRKGDPARIDQRQAFAAGYRAGYLNAAPPRCTCGRAYADGCPNDNCPLRERPTERD